MPRLPFPEDASPAASVRRAGLLGAFLLAFALVYALQPLRNALVTGVLDIGGMATYMVTRFERRSGAESYGPGAEGRGLDLGAIGQYDGARALYMLGIPQFLQPTFRARPHWWLMWGLFAVAVGAMVVRRRVAFPDLVILIVIVLYLGPLLLVAHIHNYGYRMLAPAVPFVLLFSFKGLEVLLQRHRHAQPQRAPAGA